MSALAILACLLRFAAWELALFAAAFRLSQAWQRPAGEGSAAERWLLVLGIEVTLESTLATGLSLAHLNSAAVYWAIAALLAVWAGYRPWLAAWREMGWAEILTYRRMAACIATLAVPLLLVGFRPVEEIDSINYLHYLIDWMGNRGTPYEFANFYVPFWEITFLPAWMVTGVDLFFPLLALKAVVLVALAAWRLGRELGVKPAVLGWTIFSALAMRHYWLEYSGVATLKNDAPLAAGFLLLTLVVVRAAQRPLAPGDIALLALGLIFTTGKFLGVFMAVIVVGILIWLRRKDAGFFRRLMWPAAALLLTNGHYYLRAWWLFGNPFRPYQINFGFIHLPGVADVSFTSILYHLHDPRLWRAFFLPAGGVSPAGILFPEILAGGLLVCLWRSARWIIQRRKPDAADWAALLILAGWLLYVRAFWTASAGRDDLAYVLNGLNSLRYVEGVLAATEILLAGMLGRYALPLLAINAGSRLLLVYGHLPCDLFPLLTVGVMAAAVLAWLWGGRRWSWVVAGAVLVAACPLVVQRNRVLWTPYWNDLKPRIAAVRGPDLTVFALHEASYWAGHVVAAGNPIQPEVQALMPEDLDALPPASRPRHLAVLVTPGFNWRHGYAERLRGWGYQVSFENTDGALMERK